MEIIQSKDGSIIKEVRRLKEKRYRLQNEKFLIEGFRFCEEAICSEFEVESIFIETNSKEKWEQMECSEKVKDFTKIYFVTESVLKSISSTENPQGIVAVVKNKIVRPNVEAGFYILVDKVQDPGNLGTIIRTAHAAGALGVILTKGTVDVYNEKTLRSTMGSIFYVPIIIEEEHEVVDFLRKKDFELVVSSLNTDKNFFDVDLTGKIIIAVGNEGNGVSDEIMAISDIKVKIPMPGNAESLNVSIAGAIMMFEVVRQKIIR